MTHRPVRVAAIGAFAVTAFLIGPSLIDMASMTSQSGTVQSGAPGLVAPGVTGAAAQQMGNSAWRSRGRNPANSLLIMEQRRNSNRNSPAVVAGTGGSNRSTVMVCGGGMDANAAAAANVSCIFVGDDTIANINTDQSSIGDQTATSQSNSAVADEVESILEGEGIPEISQ